MLARPPSRSYRLRKTFQRHSAAVLTTAALAILLIAGSIVSVWQAIVATRAERIAVALKADSDDARAAEAEKRKTVEIDHFKEQFDKLAANSARTPDDGFETMRAKFLALAQLLKAVPDHASDWRDHLVMTVLLAGREVAPPVDLADRHGYFVDWAQVSPNGQAIVTATNDGTIQVRNYPSLQCRSAFSGPEILPDRNTWYDDYARGKDRQIPIGFLADNKTIWTISESDVRLWDADSGQPIGRPLLHPGHVEMVVSSPDSTRLVTRCVVSQPKQGKPRYHLQVWNAETAMPIADLSETTEYTGDVVFHPDSSRIVAFGRQGLFVWSAQDGQIIRHIPDFAGNEPSENFFRLAFSESGRMLAACTLERIFWFQTSDWSRDPVTTEANDGPRYLYNPRWASGSDEFVNIGFAGARRGSPSLLSYAPESVRGTLVLARNGDVRELATGRRTPPPPGRTYADEVRQFAIDNRWLFGSIDLAVERSFLHDTGLRIGRNDVAWAWFGLVNGTDSFGGYGFRSWALPMHPEAISTDEVLTWAELLTCLDSRSEALDEAEWEARRQKMVATVGARRYQLPGIDMNDRLFWLRNTTKKNKATFNRLIAEEPTFRNYLARAEWRGRTGDDAGSVSDWLAAIKLAPTSGAAMSSGWGAPWYTALKTNRSVDEYGAALALTDHQLTWKKAVNKDVAFTLTCRGALLYRLERFAEALKELDVIKTVKDEESADAVLIRAMAHRRLGEKATAQAEYRSVRAWLETTEPAVQFPNTKPVRKLALFAEAKKMFEP